MPVRRLTTRRLMIAVALLALVMTGIVGTARQMHRWAVYQQEAGMCAAATRSLLLSAKLNEAFAVSFQDLDPAMAKESKESAVSVRKQAAYFARKKQDYEKRWW